MDEHEKRQQRLNQAAEQFTDVVAQSFKAAIEQGVSAQKQNAEFTQGFFNKVLENLRAQVEDTRQMGHQLADQQQRGAEAAQTLTQESVDAYIGFVNSMFSFQREGIEASQRGDEEAVSDAPLGTTALGTTVASSPEATDTSSQADAEADAERLPLENYDSLNVRQVSERLNELRDEEVRQLRDYEAKNKNRTTLIGLLDQRIEAGSS
jgi:uncharacterized protein YdiU (UPF0061 family)